MQFETVLAEVVILVCRCVAALRVLDELLKDGHLTGFLRHDGHRYLIIRVARYGSLREELHDLRVSDPLVVLGVHAFEKLIDFRIDVLLETEKATAITRSMHIRYQLLELVLVENAERLSVDHLELIGELAEEVLVLEKLVLENQV